MKKKSGMKLGYDISLEKGTCKPTAVHFWNPESSQKSFKAEAPFKYMADALVGLSLIKLNSYVKSPVLMPHVNYHFASEAFAALDPHHHIFERSNDRISSLGIHPSKEFAHHCSEFEKAFSNAFEQAQKPWGFDLSDIGPMIDTISWFEDKIKGPILFNFNVEWSRPFREKLFAFYSFLYNLRSVIAVDVNAHVEDPSHEAVKVDAITDYFPKADYVVNDAMLYYSFKKLSAPWMNKSSRHAHQGKGEHAVDSLMLEPLQKAFHKYSHNAVSLVESLPARFLESMNQVELEEALYLAQMDWLLGSDAGLLFRIREELYGVQNGYETIFWQDFEDCGTYKNAHKLSLCCEVHESMIYSAGAA